MKNYTHRWPTDAEFDFEQHSFVVQWLVNEYNIEFRVVEVSGMETPNRIVFPDFETDIDKAATLIEGWVKWDGCCDFDVGDPDDVSYRHHYCSREGAAVIGHAIDKVYEIAAREIPRWWKWDA